MHRRRGALRLLSMVVSIGLISASPCCFIDGRRGGGEDSTLVAAAACVYCTLGTVSRNSSSVVRSCLTGLVCAVLELS